jgi:hypothetical protein
MTSDSSLSDRAERGFVQRLLNGDAWRPASATVAAEGERLLVTQKRAAELLSVNRVTIWRMTKDGMLNPVEILPGTLRYRLNEITRLAQAGTAPESLSRGSRGIGAVGVSQSCLVLTEVARGQSLFRKSRKSLSRNPREQFPGVSNWVQGLDLNQRPSGYEPDCEVAALHL